MKTCKTCDKEFSQYAQVNGIGKNLKTRSNCLECVPFGTSPYASFDREKFLCRKRKAVKKNAKKFKTEHGNYRINILRANRKKFIISLIGGGCQFCDYNKCVRNLVFHHVDENTKEFPLSSREFAFAFERLKTELLKCVVACHNCHGEIHDNLIPEDKINEEHKRFILKLMPVLEIPK